MASSRKDIKRITDREIEKVNIASLADRPTSGSRYGVCVFDAKALKERFDKFPALIKDRFNAVVDALTSADAPKYITLDGSIAGVDNLFDFLLLFCEKTAGEKNISDYIQALYTDIQNAQASSKTLQDIINDMAAWIVKLKGESAVHSGKISDAEKRLDKNDERLEDIEDYINDMVTVENSNAYHVPVPKDSRSKANVLSVGGMSYKSRNLIPFPYRGNMGAGYTETTNGITFTVLDDGRVMGNGTATGNARLSIVRNFAIPKGVVKISGGVTVDGAKNKAYIVVTAGLNGAWVTEATSMGTGKFDLTAYEYDSNDIFLLVISGTTLNNAIFEPMVSVYQETTLPYKPYFAGLRHTNVHSIKSRGAQLIPFPYESMSGTYDSVKFTVNNDGSVYVKGTATSNILFVLARNVKIHIGENVTLSGGKSKVTVSVRKSNVLGENSTLAQSANGNPNTGALAEGEAIAYVALYIGAGNTIDDTIFPMLNYGTTAAPFEPFKPDPIDIITTPESVQNIEGYGWGVSADFYNYVDLDKKQFTKCLKEKVLNGTETWYYDAKNERFRLPGIASIPAVGNKVCPCVCDVFDFNEKVYFDSDRTDGICNSAESIFVRDSRFTNLEDFKSFLAENPATLIYVLKEPIVTDISSLFTADNEIKVSENGYLEFENEYQYPVPSSIEWNIYSSHKVAFEHANTVGNPHRTTAAEVGAYSTSEADAKFVLLEDGKVPSRMLPSYVDDVVNGIMTNYGFQVREWLGETTFDEIDEDGFIKNPRRGVLYISDNDNGTSTVYRWSGSAFVPISNGNGIPEPVSNGFLRADYGAYTLVYGELLPDAPDLEGKIMRYVDGYWQPVDPPSSNPEVTDADNGKFLRVVDGKWSAVTIATAEGGSF